LGSNRFFLIPVSAFSSFDPNPEQENKAMLKSIDNNNRFKFFMFLYLYIRLYRIVWKKKLFPLKYPIFITFFNVVKIQH